MSAVDVEVTREDEALAERCSDAFYGIEGAIPSEDLAEWFSEHRIASCAQLRAENAALRERLQAVVDADVMVSSVAPGELMAAHNRFIAALEAAREHLKEPRT